MEDTCNTKGHGIVNVRSHDLGLHEVQRSKRKEENSLRALKFHRDAEPGNQVSLRGTRL